MSIVVTVERQFQYMEKPQQTTSFDVNFRIQNFDQSLSSIVSTVSTQFRQHIQHYDY